MKKAILVFLVFAGAVVGYADLAHLRMTAYVNDYVSTAAPSNVRVIEPRQAKPAAKK